MSNKTYDILKYIAQIVLPACATLYGALAGIWGFPFGEQVVATISAVDLFLGAILKVSSDGYSQIGFTAATLDEFTDNKGGEDE